MVHLAYLHVKEHALNCHQRATEKERRIALSNTSSTQLPGGCSLQQLICVVGGGGFGGSSCTGGGLCNVAAGEGTAHVAGRATCH